jgi:hypothetical protein
MYVMSFAHPRNQASAWRKVLYIVLGLITLLVCIVTVKVYRLIQTPEQVWTEKPETIESLIDQLLLEDNGSCTGIYRTRAMNSLVEIGEPVVPELIEAIETAYNRAAALTSGQERRSEWLINVDRELLQVRAAMVLGMIGDDRALPILKSLKCRHNRVICPLIDEAIKSIEN